MFDFRPFKTVELNTCDVIDQDSGIYVFREAVTRLDYVLKVFDVRDFDAYQVTEFRKLALLSAEPEIGTVYGLVNVNNEDKLFVGYLMEYIQGKTLEELLQSVDLIGLNFHYSIVAELASGMDKAHHYGVIHNDLRPHNVMLDRFGNVKIIDFLWNDIGGSQAKDVINFKAIAGKLYEKLPDADRKHAEIVHQYCQSIDNFKGAGTLISSLQEVSFELGFITPKGQQILGYLLHSKDAEINAQQSWKFDEIRSAERFFPAIAQDDAEAARSSEQVHLELTKKRERAIEKRLKVHFDALLEQLNQCEFITYRINASSRYGLRGPYEIFISLHYRIKLFKWKKLNERYPFLKAPDDESSFLDLLVSEEWAAAPFD